MEYRSDTDCYIEFIELIKKDLKNERRAVNRRMFNVFLWSFLFPFLMTLVLVVLVKLGLLPRRWSKFFDWIILIAPIIYSIYVIKAEVIIEIPTMFSKSGNSSNLNQALSQNLWRAKTCQILEQSLTASVQQWKLILENFRIDLQAFRDHSKNITAIAGAVIYFLLQGIDFLEVKESREAIARSGNLTKIFEASSSNLEQLFAIGVVLMLLYISGQQSYQALRRYLQCTELILLKKELSRND